MSATAAVVSTFSLQPSRSPRMVFCQAWKLCYCASDATHAFPGATCQQWMLLGSNELACPCPALAFELDENDAAGAALTVHAGAAVRTVRCAEHKRSSPTSLRSQLPWLRGSVPTCGSRQR
eukprot:6181638-Pleurochrysis_carterae.AAC.1